MPVQLLEDGDARAFRWGDDGKIHTFRDDEVGAHEAYRKAVAEGLARGEANKMDSLEREVAREMGVKIGLGIEKAADIGGAMYAWYPWDNDGDDDDALATAVASIYTGPGSVPVADLHLTVLYLATADQVADLDASLLFAIGRLYATWANCPEGTITGIGRFIGEGDEDVIVALVDSTGIAQFRQWLLEEVSCRGGLPWNTPALSPTHGFIPHITLGYVPKGTPTPAWPFEGTLPFRMDDLTLTVAGDTFSFELGGGDGWAETATSPAPFYAARLEDALKAGRIHSGATLGKLQGLATSIQEMIDAETSRRAQAGLEGDAEAQKDSGLEYQVTKAVGDKRYTFGPLYAPARKDAHGEYVADDTLHDAVIGFMQDRFDAGDNRLTLQHESFGEVYCGRIVECARWPYDHEIDITVPGEATRKVAMPAGTVYMGVVWDEDAWTADGPVNPLTKERLTGYSLGGRAVRVASQAQLPEMGDKLASRVLGGGVGEIQAEGFQTGYFGAPGTMKAADIEEAIRRVALKVKPDGGYGDTFWNESTKTVHWIPADWSTTEEQATADRLFRSIEGVEDVFIAESESAAPTSKGEWTIITRADSAGKGDYHDFVSEGGGEGTSGTCAECNKSYSAGMHNGNGSDPKNKALTQLDVVEALALKHRTDVDEERGLLRAALDALKAAVSKAPVTVDVHLPDQPDVNVTLKQTVENE